MALDLSKQVGPLPLGAWIAVVAGGLGLAYFMNKNQTAGDDDPAQLTESGVGVGAGGFTPVPPFADQPDEDKLPDTNDSWGKRVSDWLIAQGHDPTVSVNAVAKYLSGETLSLQEKALINLALIKHGTQPEPLPPAKVTPTPTPTSYKISLTVQPKTNLRRGASMAFGGFVTTSTGAKAPNKVVQVEYRNSGSSKWVPSTGYPSVSNKNGTWGFRARAYKTRQWRFRVVGTDAIVTSKTIYVK